MTQPARNVRDELRETSTSARAFRLRDPAVAPLDAIALLHQVGRRAARQ